MENLDLYSEREENDTTLKNKSKKYIWDPNPKEYNYLDNEIFKERLKNKKKEKKREEEMKIVDQ